MIIESFNLTRTYRLGSSLITAVNHVDIKVERSSFVTIVGPSGSGKTTLLNLLGLVDSPTSGKVVFEGKDTTILSEAARRQIRLRNIGFVFQTFNLLPILNALENVELPISLLGRSNEEQRKRAASLLENVGLASRLYHRPKEMSSGEMQRVAIARALANDPSMILADEPTGELDSETGSEIVKLLLDLCKGQGKTVIVATHDEKITKAADCVYKIRDGSVARQK